MAGRFSGKNGVAAAADSIEQWGVKPMKRDCGPGAGATTPGGR